MLPDQRTMLGEMPDVSWIPSDICARAICDLVVHETSAQEDQANVTVHNLANPHIRSWKDVVVDSCGIIGCEVPEFVALPEFVDMLGDADSPDSQSAATSTGNTCVFCYPSRDPTNPVLV